MSEVSRVTCTRTWADGERIQSSALLDSDRPEAMAVARVNAVEAYREQVADALAEWGQDKGPSKETIREEGGASE
jgi:hypothetical protein